MGSVRRECCNYCMWYGPVNADGTMRKHRPATHDDKWGRPNKVQDRTAEPCPGSNKPYVRFGTVEEAIEDAQEATVTEPTVASTRANEYVPSRDAAIAAARIALAELKATEREANGWKANPIYWVGYLAGALEQTLKAIDQTEGDKAQEANVSEAIEYGIFEDGICIEAGFHGQVGRIEATRIIAHLTGAAPEMAGAYEVLEICPDHDEQPRHTCEDCASDN